MAINVGFGKYYLSQTEYRSGISRTEPDVTRPIHLSLA